MSVWGFVLLITNRRGWFFAPQHLSSHECENGRSTQMWAILYANERPALTRANCGLLENDFLCLANYLWAVAVWQPSNGKILLSK